MATCVRCRSPLTPDGQFCGACGTPAGPGDPYGAGPEPAAPGYGPGPGGSTYGPGPGAPGYGPGPGAPTYAADPGPRPDWRPPAQVLPAPTQYGPGPRRPGPPRPPSRGPRPALIAGAVIAVLAVAGGATAVALGLGSSKAAPPVPTFAPVPLPKPAPVPASIPAQVSRRSPADVGPADRHRSRRPAAPPARRGCRAGRVARREVDPATVVEAGGRRRRRHPLRRRRRVGRLPVLAAEGAEQRADPVRAVHELPRQGLLGDAGCRAVRHPRGRERVVRDPAAGTRRLLRQAAVPHRGPAGNTRPR